MKILVWEYITGGGLRGERLPEGLAREGEMMLRALTGDLLALPDVSVTVLRDDRLPDLPCSPHLTVIPVGEQDDLSTLSHERVRGCDAVWPVAPESGGILEGLCRDVERAGKILLNTPAEGVQLAASKFATVSRLARHGLPVVPTTRLAKGAAARPRVIKPDDGVGCERARILQSGEDLPDDTDSTRWVEQPLVEGEALSLSALFARGDARLLACNRQRVACRGGGFVLRGCLVNAIADDEGRWQTLVADIARACPELWGYAGIDLLLTPSGPLILEINPRLTTSYVGLHRALGLNPAGLLLDLLRSGTLPPPLAVTGRSVDISLEESVDD
ncbi:MAG: hypothetical protein H6R26_2442 [Proteobacteria bacterium]|nr:hypothetical protein [Pseudomonadota bacterium]